MRPDPLSIASKIYVYLRRLRIPRRRRSDGVIPFNRLIATKIVVNLYIQGAALDAAASSSSSSSSQSPAAPFLHEKTEYKYEEPVN